MNSLTRAFTNKCTSNAKTFYSEERPCISGLTSKGVLNNCCGQSDIKFLEGVAAIYLSRSNSRFDTGLEDVLSYVEQYHNFVSSMDYVDVRLNSKKGRYILGLAEMYESTVPLILYQDKRTGFKTANLSSKKVIYIVHGLENIDAPVHRYLSIKGDKSTVNFNSLKLFSRPGSVEFEHVLDTIKGKSFMDIDVPFNLDGAMSDFDILSTIVNSFVRIGDALTSIGNTDTVFHFQVRYDMTKEHMRTVVSGIDLEFEDTDEGARYQKRIFDTLLSIEIRTLPGVGLVFLLKTMHAQEGVRHDVQLDEMVMTPEDVVNKTATDIITFEEMTVEDYLKGDPKNMVVFSKHVPHFTNEDDIAVAMQDGIVYACKTANAHLFQDASNVESDVELFNARRIGTLGGYIIADHLRAAMGLQTRIVALSESIKTVPTVISKKVYHGQDDLVSANHCQPGAEGGVFGLRVIKF